MIFWLWFWQGAGAPAAARRPPGAPSASPAIAAKAEKEKRGEERAHGLARKSGRTCRVRGAALGHERFNRRCRAGWQVYASSVCPRSHPTVSGQVISIGPGRVDLVPRAIEGRVNALGIETHVANDMNRKPRQFHDRPPFLTVSEHRLPARLQCPEKVVPRSTKRHGSPKLHHRHLNTPPNERAKLNRFISRADLRFEPVQRYALHSRGQELF